MTNEEAGKLPKYLQDKEEKLRMAQEALRAACDDAVRINERLSAVLQQARTLLDENNG